MTTQLDCTIGQSPAEAAYGTNTTVDRFYEFVDESFDWVPTFVQGEGLRVSSRTPRSGRRKLGKSMASGDLTVECVTKGMGRLWKAALGSATSTLVAGSTYQQTHIPLNTDPMDSFTFQKGIPPIGGGATLPHTFTGGMCTGFNLSAVNGGVAKLKTSWAFKDVTTATAYASPSYATNPELFTFVDGAITIGGTITPPSSNTLTTGGTSVGNILDFSLDWDNKLDGGGFTFGGGGKRGRKQVLTGGAGKGKITAEFTAVTLRDAFLNQSDLAIVLTFTTTAAPISGALYPTMQVTIPVVRLEGELPKANGGDVVTQSIDFTALDGLTNAPLYVALLTADTAI